jgi:hypothetical protein
VHSHCRKTALPAGLPDDRLPFNRFKVTSLKADFRLDQNCAKFRRGTYDPA